MKKYLAILVLGIVVIPQVALAAWWNPFSWHVWSVFRSDPSMVVNREEMATSTQRSARVLEPKEESKNPQEAVAEIEDLKKEIESLKKNQAKSVPAIHQKSEGVKVDTVKVSEQGAPLTTAKTVTLPNGAIAEVDSKGSFVRFIKEVSFEYIPPLTRSVESVKENPVVLASLPVSQPNLVSVSSVKISPTLVSVRIEWQTNTPTTSKIFLFGGKSALKVHQSESGLSTRHIVDIVGLTPGEVYNYEIEAISGSDVGRASGTFNTVKQNIYIEVYTVNPGEKEFHVFSDEEVTIEKLVFVVKDVVSKNRRISEGSVQYSFEGDRHNTSYYKDVLVDGGKLVYTPNSPIKLNKGGRIKWRIAEGTTIISLPQTSEDFLKSYSEVFVPNESVIVGVNGASLLLPDFRLDEEVGF